MYDAHSLMHVRVEVLTFLADRSQAEGLKSVRERF